MTAAERPAAEAGEDVVERIARAIYEATPPPCYYPNADAPILWNDSHADKATAYARARAALAAMPEPPEGYVLVPREPTEAMLEAGRNTPISHAWGSGGEYNSSPEATWDAMLAASPVPPAPPPPEGYVLDAMNRTVQLARERNMPSTGTPLDYDHIAGMQMTMQEGGFSSDKANRWLGWAQCAVVAAGCATLDEMRKINCEALAASPVPPAPQSDDYRRGVLAGRDEAAKVADDGAELALEEDWSTAAEKIAAAIRALEKP